MELLMKKFKAGDYVILNDGFDKPIRSCLVISSTNDLHNYYVLENYNFNLVFLMKRDSVVCTVI